MVYLCGFILKQFGLGSLIEKVFDRLGDLQEVYLAHDWSKDKIDPLRIGWYLGR
jgi:hypothetical protein